ncbi:hypothetical protein [Paenibacillus prosopidis]|uniref:hypothetical protein n=1 Tax=Paenibacillus prosopidis TaxID=630520 RepID=UPI0015F130C1|nr:hypothetical protein [Paenibacillus prosopidis]
MIQTRQAAEYCDIYRQLMDEQAVRDMATIQQKNTIGEYHFWTQESVVFSMLDYT